MAIARPVRAMDPYAEQFWAFTRERELRLQQCAACGKFRWPPGPTCDRCLSDDFAWSALSGRATVLSWTTFHRGYFPEYPPPHTIVALELAEGPLFISSPVGLQPDGAARGDDAGGPVGGWVRPVRGLQLAGVRPVRRGRLKSAAPRAHSFNHGTGAERGAEGLVREDNRPGARFFAVAPASDGRPLSRRPQLLA